MVQRNSVTPTRPRSVAVVKAQSLERDLLRSLDDIQNVLLQTRNGDAASPGPEFCNAMPDVACLGAEVKQIHMALRTAQQDGNNQAQPILRMMEVAKSDKLAAQEKVDNLSKRCTECEPVKSLKMESLGLVLPKLEPDADNQAKLKYHLKLVEILKEEDRKRKELTKKLELLRKKKNDGLSALKTKGLNIKSFPRRVTDVVEAAERLRQYCEPTSDNGKK